MSDAPIGPQEKPPPEENLVLYGAVCGIFDFIDGDPHVVVVVDVPRLAEFYRNRIKVPIHIGTWNEIERTLLFRLNEVKPLLRKKGKPIQIRIIGPMETWLGMKLYKTLYPHADQTFFVDGQAVIEI